MQNSRPTSVLNGTMPQHTPATRFPTAGLAPAFSDPLWIDLDEFRIDDGDPALTFEARLARENSWSLVFARRVVNEYKRFVYLAIRAGHAVTPSEEVDEAWHMHMTYTRSYWDHLCANVLPKPLHHGPTRGGAKEDQKFNDWYQKTLESYRKHFGEAPPNDIWPSPAKRFDPRERSVKVKLSEHYVIPRARVRKLGVLGTLGAILAGSLGLAGCATMFNQGVPAVLTGVLIFVGIVLVVIVISALSGRQNPRHRARRRFSSTDTSAGHVGTWMGVHDSSSPSHGHGHSHGHGTGHGHGHSHPDTTTYTDGMPDYSGPSDGGSTDSGSSDSGSSDSGSAGCGASSGCSSSGCGGGGCGGGGD